MNFIFIIVTTLVTTAPVKGAMECNIVADIKRQCVGALGQPLNFNLPSCANRQIILTKDDLTILKIVNYTETTNRYRDHASFFPNGTFRFKSVRESDSGDYTLEIYRLPVGRLLHNTTIDLKIQAPVSQPVLSQVCLSPEKMRVGCSSEGDGVEFNLTLDSNVLIKTRAGNTDEHHMPSVTITLYGHLTGILTCHVQNNVSREETFIHLMNCGESICHIIVAVRAVVVTLLLLGLCLAVYHVQKKTRPKT